MTWIAIPFLVAALVGCLYLAAAALLVGRFAQRPPAPSGPEPAVTVLKPLCGAEPLLLENLASFCDQDYGGPVQIVFGVQSPNDPAIAVVERLRAERPGRDLDLVIDATAHGANRKVANLINMEPYVRHELVVLADSDMRVGPDYLSRVVAELQQPGVGVVTCLYHGLPRGGLWSRLSAQMIDAAFLPSVVVGVSFGLAAPCFGSTIALRRETLDRIGGFRAFAEGLADDHAIGEAVRRLGLEAAIPPFTIGHLCPEASAGELWRHELRWARTIRSINPPGHYGAAITHPLAFALIGAALGGGAPCLAAALLAMACRAALSVRVERAFGLPPRLHWLGPVRDLLSFAVYLRSLFGGAVTWKGHDYRVRSDGSLVSQGGRPPHDAVPVPASALVRRFRRRRRLPLPGQARDQVVLVSDLARPAGRPRRGLEADRRTAAPHRPRRGDEPGA